MRFPNTLRRLSCTLVMLAVWIAARPAAAQGPLVSGETVSGFFANGSSTLWTFNANAGDAFVVRIGKLSQTGPMSPQITVYTPTMVAVGTDHGSHAAEISSIAAVSGTYSVLVSDYAPNTATGTYQLSLAISGHDVVVPLGDEGGAMTNGVTHLGTITEGELDVWTITANAGDVIIARMGDASSTGFLAPQLRLYRPNGQQLPASSGNRGAEVSDSVTTSGTYMLVASDALGNETVVGGDYRLTLARTGTPVVISAGDEGGPMTNGATHTGTITLGDLDLWTITANAGDAIVVRMGDTSGGFQPGLRLFSPTGAEVASNYGNRYAEVAANAPVTGEYLLIADDAANFETSGTGPYRLTLARTGAAVSISSGDEGGPMTNGATHLGTIDMGDLDVWTIAANTGDRIVVRMGDSNATLRPGLRLYGPTGALVTHNEGNRMAEIEAVVPVGGEYLLLADDETGPETSSTGAYRLTLARTGAPVSVSVGDEGGSLANGIQATGTIDVGDLDVWTITANVGDAIVVRITDTSANSGLAPGMRLYGPNGAFVTRASSSSTAELAAIATTAGEYLLLVDDAQSADQLGTGNYRMNMSKTGAAVTTSPGDEGGALSSLVNGTIVVGDLDLWTLDAVAGQALTAVMEEITFNGPLTPLLRLYSPTGVLLASNGGASRALVSATANVTGTYLLVATDTTSGFGGSGAYRLAPSYTTAIEESPRSFAFTFAAPSPNPCVGRTALRYTLPAESDVTLMLFDAQGRRVRTLVDERGAAAGEHAVAWDGRDAGGAAMRPGLYFARLRAAGHESVQKVLLAR